MAALVAFNADAACQTAFENDNTDVTCTGTCQTLTNTVISACPKVSI